MEPIYIVMIIILIIWLGIFGYLFYLDKEVRKLSEKIKQLDQNKK
jgi:CcmD family protein